MMDEGITLERDFSFQGKKFSIQVIKKEGGGETYEEEHDFLLSLLELQTFGLP